MNRPSRLQQALAGLSVMFVVAVTLAGGLLLAFSDNPGALGAGGRPTSTPFQRPTLPPPTPTPDQVAEQLSPTPTNLQPTATDQPTATITIVPSKTPIPSPTSCTVASNWVPYRVRSGDALSEIAARYGLSIPELMEGNCLTSASINAGTIVYVPDIATSPPRSTPAPLPTATSFPGPDFTPGPTPTHSGSDGICTNTSDTITQPVVGALLSGMTSFYGTATHEDFNFYKIEFRKYNSPRDSWITAITSYEPVTDGFLGELNTPGIANGMYWIRLVVVDSVGNFPEPCSRLYRITN